MAALALRSRPTCVAVHAAPGLLRLAEEALEVLERAVAKEETGDSRRAALFGGGAATAMSVEKTAEKRALRQGEKMRAVVEYGVLALLHRHSAAVGH